MTQAVIVSLEEYTLAICANGFGKRTPVTKTRMQNRGGKGVIAVDTSERNGDLVALLIVTAVDDVLLVTARGKTERLSVHDIRVTERTAQGVKLMDVEEGDRITAATVVSDPDSLASDLGMMLSDEAQ